MDAAVAMTCYIIETRDGLIKSFQNQRDNVARFRQKIYSDLNARHS